MEAGSVDVVVVEVVSSLELEVVECCCVTDAPD